MILIGVIDSTQVYVMLVGLNALGLVIGNVSF